MVLNQSYEASIPFEAERVGAAAVYCSDGRYGEQMDEFLHASLGLPRYDRVAVPGGAACLAGHVAVWREEEALAQQLRFLIAAHELDRMVLIAHQDCGFYKNRLGLAPADLEAQQRADLVRAISRTSVFGSGLSIEAYLARRVGDRVRFERVPAELAAGAPR